MNAKEVFAMLGYKQNKEEDYIEYIKTDNTHTSKIIFFTYDKTIQAYKYENWKGEDDSFALSITIQELQVINYQCKELGWYE